MEPEETIEVLVAVTRYDPSIDALVIQRADMTYLLETLSSKEFRLYFIYTWFSSTGEAPSVEYIRKLTTWSLGEIALHTISLIDAGVAWGNKEKVEEYRGKINKSYGGEDSR